MGDDLNLEILPPKQRPTAQRLSWPPIRSRDYRSYSEHLRRPYQSEPPGIHDNIDGWMLRQINEAVLGYNCVFEAEREEPTTDYVTTKLLPIILRLRNSYLRVFVKLIIWCSSLDEDNIYQAICEPDQSDPSTSDHIAEQPTDENQQPDDQCALAYLEPSYDQDIESLLQQTPAHSRNARRVTVCHALMGISVLGVATSLSLALWWSFAHGDPGSGFTIGSYVLAVSGVLVGIPGYRHSKNCQCWKSKPKGA